MEMNILANGNQIKKKDMVYIILKIMVVKEIQQLNKFTLGNLKII